MTCGAWTIGAGMNVVEPSGLVVVIGALDTGVLNCGDVTYPGYG
jgi:hypothetical protein